MSQLGERLFEERKQKGITLDQLQEVTKIQKRYLKAIEEGDFDSLPGSFYARAFVKQYADAVGLNGEEIVEEYKNELPIGVNEELSSQLSRVKTAKTIDRKSSKIVDNLPVIIVGIIVIGIAIGIWYYFQSKGSTTQPKEKETDLTTEVETPENSPLDKENQKDEDEVKEDEEPIVEEPVEPNAKQKINVVSKEGMTSTLSLENNDTFELSFEITGRSYIDVKSNTTNKSYFNGIIEVGQEKKWILDEESEIFIRVGYSPGVEMKINGQKVEFPIQATPENSVQNIIIQNKGITTTD